MESSGTHCFQIHGVALECDGLGILILGESCSGKSTAALDLLSRGYRLIADDAVLLCVNGKGELVAKPHEFVRGLINTRESGTITAQYMFGSESTLNEALIGLCFELTGLNYSAGAFPAGRSRVRLAGVEIPVYEVRISRNGGAAEYIEAVVNEHLL